MNNRQKPSRSFNTVKHSNREGRIKRHEHGRMLLLAIFAVAAAIFLTLLIFLVASVADAVKDRLPAKDPEQNGTTDESPKQDPPADAVVYVQGSQDNQNIHIGPLVEVNAEHEYTAFDREENKLINMYQNISKDEDERNICQFGGTDLLLHKSAFSAFNELAKAYVSAEGSRDLLVTSAYRNYEDQEKYDLPPGHSDHHTGYLLTLKQAIFNEGVFTSSVLFNEDSWLYTNAHKYGFVIRYPDDKKDSTLIDYDYSYAFRYVGVAHATYMYKYDYCLEEYLEKLRTDHSGSENSLKITDDSGNRYEVYYARANSGDVTLLDLPSNYQYEISGDNTSGFVVTVLLNSPKA